MKNIQDFFEGIGNVIDIFPNQTKNPIEEKSDSERLKSDWEKVGKDIYKAMEGLNNGKQFK